MSKKKSIIITVISVLLIIAAAGIIYFFPLIKLMIKGGNQIPKEELDSATQDYMAIIESMNAQTGTSDNSNSSSNDNSNTQSNGNSSSADSADKSDAENSLSDDNSDVPEKSDGNSSADENSQVNDIPDNSTGQTEQKPVQTNPPEKDYSQFLGTWKGYFGTEMEPTYIGVFEDLGFELISCDGQDITYTFWLTCSGTTKKLDASYGRVDENNRLNIVINGNSARLTLDLVFEENGSVWGVVSNAYIMDQEVTFPVLFFQKQ